MAITNKETILAAVREWIRTTCPHIDKANRFNVNYLGDKAVNYTVDLVPTELIYDVYMSGKMLSRNQEQAFVFSVRLPYGDDVSVNLNMANELNKIVDWLVAQNTYPEVTGVTIKDIVVTATPYPIEAGADSANYQIQFRVDYQI